MTIEAAILLFLAGVLVVVFLHLRASLLEGQRSLTRDIVEDLARGRREQSEVLAEATRTLTENFEKLRSETERRLTEIRREVDAKLEGTVAQNLKNFEGVSKRLEDLAGATAQVVSLSEGVRDLNVLLQTPKGRGNFGEMTLEELLADLLGDATDLHRLQYHLADGRVVDAVVFLDSPEGEGEKRCLCIDAKFPLSQALDLLEGRTEKATDFKNAVKKHARDIRDRYIKPPETTDFAFLFVPSEAVFYLILKEHDLHEELLQMRVVPVSPNSFYAYLRVLRMAVEGRRIEAHAREILRLIQALSTDFGAFAEDFGRMGTHIKNLTTKYDDAARRVEKFQARMENIRRISPGSKEGERSALANGNGA